jgi:hypothetical protein
MIEGLTPEARRGMRAAYAKVELYDSTNHQAANQVGVSRVYNQQLGEHIDHIGSLVTSRDPAFHQMTSVLDTIALSELATARQNEETAQLQANLVAQRLARAAAQRDGTASALMREINRLRDRGTTANALVGGSAMPANGGQP